MAAYQIRVFSDAAIITGGLSPLLEPVISVGERQSDYLTRLLPHLKSALFTGVSIHPYSWPVLPDIAADYNAFYTVDQGDSEYNLRTIMTKAGWGDKQIWGTEYGASTVGLRKVSKPTKHNRPDHVSETKQAQLVEKGIAKWCEKQNVGPLFVHSDSDEWLPNRKNEGGFGLRRSDGSKKPAYDAFKAAARQLRKQ